MSGSSSTSADLCRQDQILRFLSRHRGHGVDLILIDSARRPAGRVSTMTCRRRTGIWLIGLRGSVAVTSIVGARRSGRWPGRPGWSPSCRRCRAPARRTWPISSSAAMTWSAHRWARRPALAAARTAAGGRCRRWARNCAAVEDDLRPAPHGRAQADGTRIAADLDAFRDRTACTSRVVNVSTTEPAVARQPAHDVTGGSRSGLVRRPRPATEFALRLRRLHRAVLLCGLHPVHRGPAAGTGGTGPAPRRRVRRTRRQDR